MTLRDLIKQLLDADTDMDTPIESIDQMLWPEQIKVVAETVPVAFDSDVTETTLRISEQ